MSGEMRNTNAPSEEKNNNKKKAVIIVIALFLLGCIICIPLFMGGQKDDTDLQAAVTLQDEEVPLAADVEEAVEPEVEDTNTTPETDNEVIDTTNTEDTEDTDTTESEVLGESRIITDPEELVEEIEVINEIIEAAAQTPAPAGGSGPTDTSAADEAAREAADRAARVAARVAALEAKINALKEALEAVKGDSKAEAPLAADLYEATVEYTASVDAANAALTEAKEAAVVVAKTAGVSMEAIQGLLKDENSEIYEYFNKRGMGWDDQDGLDLDSTGRNWALGGAYMAGNGVNAEIVDAAQKIETAKGENTDSDVMTEIEKLPTKTSDDTVKKNPEVAYNVTQQIVDGDTSNKNFSIIWAPEYDAVEKGNPITVYYLDFEGRLFIATALKAEDNGLTIGGETADVTNMTQVTIPDGQTAESTLIYLQGLSAENYSAQAIVNGEEVEEAADAVAEVVNDELLATLNELAEAREITLEAAAAEYEVVLPTNDTQNQEQEQHQEEEEPYFKEEEEPYFKEETEPFFEEEE